MASAIRSAACPPPRPPENSDRGAPQGFRPRRQPTTVAPTGMAHVSLAALDARWFAATLTKAKTSRPRAPAGRRLPPIVLLYLRARRKSRHERRRRAR